MFMKSMIVSLALLASTAYAEGVEEICHDRAKIAISTKNKMQANPQILQLYLEFVDQQKISSEVKAKAREAYYYIYNRRSMSDLDIQRLVFLRCISGTG